MSTYRLGVVGLGLLGIYLIIYGLMMLPSIVSMYSSMLRVDELTPGRTMAGTVWTAGAAAVIALVAGSTLVKFRTHLSTHLFAGEEESESM